MWVEVAIDAAGPAGGQTYTYHVPDRHRDVQPGELVLVEYGRRQAVGIVLEERKSAPDRDTKPVLARIRSGGPLLPLLQLQLARHIADHYLAPPALVLRQMLPPGVLERVELVTRLLPGSDTGRAGDAVEGAAGDAVLEAIQAAGPDGVALDRLPRTGGRASLLRHVRGLAAADLVELEWRVVAAQPNERLERRVALTDAGREAAAALGAGEQPGGRRLGRRQQAVLLELAVAGEPVVAARLSERHGTGWAQSLLRRGLVSLETVRIERRPLAGRSAPTRGTLPDDGRLTPEQAGATALVEGALARREHVAVLLEGATASGKSAVYAAMIDAALAAGRGAVVLVPEIALAVPLLDRLARDLGVEVALLHSGLSDGERADEWRRIRAGEARVVVGTRLAALAPLGDPGVVIVDEEHDAAYKSDRTPRLQARDVCVELARLAAAAVVLGSATPDVASVGRARRGELRHVRLPERLAGRPPAVEVVDLREEMAAGNRGLLSAPLVDALTGLDVESGERAILAINRRGSASVVLCRDCGYVQICPECQRPLVFHAAALALRCHHCGANAPVARRCPACQSVRIRYLGGGTERVEREVRLRFPDYRVGRLDRDVSERKGAAGRVVDQFSGGELDVLVGTSLVTKGLDVPEVTLVGVISADVALNLPDERAAERTFQLLVQAIGRAGRGDRPGRAIIQSYLPQHPAIQAAAQGDHDAFYEAELKVREAFGSPPFGRLVKLTVAHEERAAAERAADEMAARLRERAASGGVEVLGPVAAYIARRGGRWRFHVVLRGREPLAVLGGDPGSPWSVDVDPESLL
jgi:primosomal protein N' (replication factor Y) (superfamily II helicase)